MQKVIFGNKQPMDIESVQGRRMDDSDTITITFSDKATDYAALKKIFLDPNLLNQVTIETYSPESGEKTASKLLMEYTHPISLSFEPGRFLMTIRKPTADEQILKMVKAQFAGSTVHL